MHIGYLVQQFPPEVGAGPARVAEMALRWKAEGAEVTVVTGMPNRPEGRIHPEYRGRAFLEEEWNGIRVLRSWLYASPRHGFLRTIANNATFMATGALHALQRLGPVDVLIASSPPFFVHPAGELVSRLRRIPLVLEVRDLWPDYVVDMGVLKPGPATRALFALERHMLRRASRVVVVTESFRERVRRKGVDPARVHVVSNGVDTAQYFRSPVEEVPVPSLRRGEGEFVVGYLGNFGAGQALGHVLDAAAEVLRRDPGIRFVFVGDGPERERLEARAAEIGSPRIAIHGPIRKEQTPAFYNACDLCLVPLAPFPVLQETVPSKIFEVMACERPVLAAVAGEAARIVERSGGGWVVPPGDARALADAVLEMRALPAEEHAALGRRGREYVSRHYSRDALAAHYLEVLTAAGCPGPARVPAEVGS